jgi:hypothetical protein
VHGRSWSLPIFWSTQALILGSQSTYVRGLLASSLPCVWEMSQVSWRKLEIFNGRYDNSHAFGPFTCLANSTSLQILGPFTDWSFNISLSTLNLCPTKTLLSNHWFCGLNKFCLKSFVSVRMTWALITFLFLWKIGARKISNILLKLRMASKSSSCTPSFDHH